MGASVSVTAGGGIGAFSASFTASTSFKKSSSSIEKE